MESSTFDNYATVGELLDQLKDMPRDYHVVCGCGTEVNHAENMMASQPENEEKLVILLRK